MKLKVHIVIFFHFFFMSLISGCALMGINERAPTVSDLIDIPLTPFHWQVVYGQPGNIKFQYLQTKDLYLQSENEQAADKTSAALLILNFGLQRPFRNFILEVEATTVKQFRPHLKNDWEVFWLFTNYRIGQDEKKETNYFLAKPNSGVELGKAFSEVGQTFLSTKDNQSFSIGKKMKYLFVKNDHQYTVYLNDRRAINYYHQSGEMKIYDHAGTIGLYVEDAAVIVHRVGIKVLDE